MAILALIKVSEAAMRRDKWTVGSRQWAVVGVPAKQLYEAAKRAKNAEIAVVAREEIAKAGTERKQLTTPLPVRAGCRAVVPRRLDLE